MMVDFLTSILPRIEKDRERNLRNTLLFNLGVGVFVAQTILFCMTFLLGLNQYIAIFSLAYALVGLVTAIICWFGQTDLAGGVGSISAIIAATAIQPFIEFQFDLTLCVIVTFSSVFVISGKRWIGVCIFAILALLLKAILSGDLVTGFTEAYLGSAILVIAVLCANTFHKMLTRETENERAVKNELQIDQELLLQKTSKLEQEKTDLTERHDWYQNLVEKISEAMFVLNFGSWQIVDVNNASLTLLGYKRDELVGANADKLTSSEFVPAHVLATMRQKLTKREIVVFDSVIVNSENRPINCEVRLSLIEDVTPPLIRASIISEQQKTVVATHVEDLQKQFDIISKYIPARIVYFNRNLEFEFWNDEFLRVYGQNGVVPRSISEAFTANDIQTIMPYIHQVFAGETVKFELSLTTAAGRQTTALTTYVPNKVGENVEGAFAITIDVTDLRNTKIALQERSDQLELIINNIPGRVSFFNANREFVFANKQFEYLGYPVEELIGKTPWEILPYADRDELNRISDLAYSGERVSDQVKRVDENGAEFYENYLLVPQILHGEVIGVYCLVTDITEIKKAELALQNAQKLESLGLLAGSIAHDFNNLLVAMMSQNAIASYKLQGDHPAKKHVDKAVRATEEAAELIKQMLAYSGKGKVSVSLIDLNSLVEQSLSLLRSTIDKNIELCPIFAANLPRIEGDRTQVQQVIMNLVINAAQAIGNQHGRITIESALISAENISPNVNFFTAENNHSEQYVRLSVQDTGKGMSQEVLEQIFDPFFTTKKEGTGLGLAAVLGIIRGHEGGLQVSSHLGEGTTFEFYFPAQLVPPTANNLSVSFDNIPIKA